VSGEPHAFGRQAARPSLRPRQAGILEAVRAQGAVSVSSLASRFEVTHQTIRRDLKALQDLGLLQKRFGAAFAAPGVARHAHDERQATLFGVKRQLVQALDEFLTPGVTMFVGLGTTFESLHEVLLRHPGVLVATPNLSVAHTCALNTDATVYVYGGYVRNKDSAVLTMNDESRTRFRFDLAVIGASAIDEEGNILEFDPMEVELLRAVLPRSRRVIFLAHAEKFGRHAPHMVASLADVDVLITNADPGLLLKPGCLPRGLRVIAAG
jgi:DeoR family glycerol-3-phosphate regulon repressor